MDVFPRCKAAALAIEEFNTKCKRVCAIDANHRCSNACEYYVCAKYRTAVCKLSRHTHFCRQNCLLGTQEKDGTYCRITAFQTAGPKEEAHMNCTKVMYGKRFSNVHWGPVQTKAAKLKESTVHAKRVRGMLVFLFVSKDRKKVSQEAREKVMKKMKDLLQKGTVAAYYAAVAHRQKMALSLRPVPKELPEPFVQYIIAQTDRIRAECTRRSIPCKRTDASLVLGLLQLLSTGFTACGATLIPKSPFVAAHGLSLSQYGLMPTIR